MTRHARLRPVRTVASLSAAALLLSACSGDGSPTSSPEGTESPTGTATATTDATDPTDAATPSETADPDALTEPGSELRFGEAARVDYQPKEGRGSELALTVRSARRARISDFKGFNLDDPYKKNAHYYYVQVAVENVGERRIQGGDVPLWGVSGVNTLLPAVRLTSSFEKCQTESMPRRFKPGDRMRTCLVYLSPDKGSLEGVSYRPSEEYDPIVWTGKVTKPGPAAKGKGGAGKGGADKGGAGRGGSDKGRSN